jgi:predicted HD phosphohydrolase
VKLAKTVRYRVEQFLRALTAQHAISEKRIKRAAEVLSPEARGLFAQQAPQDQLHALDVYEALLEEGHSDRHLLTAALLHDVGKAAARTPAWQRAIFVLTERFAPGALDHLLEHGAGGWKGPMRTYAHHAEIGARWAEEAGCSKLTVALIRHHEDPVAAHRTERDRLLAALQAADDVS